MSEKPTPVFLEVAANVRYWDDATINGQAEESGANVPFKNGETWAPVIRLADGVIENWPTGTIADIHFKVCDAGEYWLLDEAKKRIAKWGGYYVPDDFLCPGTNGYGDYIILKVAGDGQIEKWKQPGVSWSCSCDDEGDDDGNQYSWKLLPLQ